MLTKSVIISGLRGTLVQLLALHIYMLLLIAPATGRASTVDATPGTTPAQVMITGTVKTPEGQTIGGASLELVTFSEVQGDILARESSSAGGGYTVTAKLEVPSNQYIMLKVGAKGHVSLYHVIYELMAPLDREAGQITIERQVILPKSAPVAGQVVDENDQPATGVTVRGTALDSVHEGVVADAAVTTSGENGEFYLEGLPEGQVAITAAINGQRLHKTTATAPMESLRLQVSGRTGSISGIVVGPGDEPLPGAEVNLQSAARPDWFGYTSDPPRSQIAGTDGSFKFDKIPAGTYFVYPQADDLISVFPNTQDRQFKLADGETTSGIRLEMYPGLEVTGKVTEAGTSRALSGVTVYWGDPQGVDVPVAISDNNGVYKLTGIQPEPFTENRIFAKAENHVLRESSMPPHAGMSAFAHIHPKADYKTVQIPAGERSVEIDLQMEPARVIKGMVVDENGSPISEAEISIGRQWHYGSTEKAAAVTDQDGFFTATGDNDKGLKVFASVPGRPVVSVPAPPVDDSTTITLTVYPPASLSGMVVTHDGQPAGNTHIQVGRNDSPSETGMANNLPDARSLADGTFTVSDLPGGNISLFAQKDGYAPSGFQRYVVKPGESRKGITLRLKQGFNISGRITDEAGKPVSGVRVSVEAVDDEAEPVFANTESKLDGSYVLNGVPGIPVYVELWGQGVQVRGENINPETAGSQDFVIKPQPVRN